VLLIGAVGAVGVLHTIVPDHWAPIVVMARQRGWSNAETACAALQAGTGHVLSTLVIASAVWAAGIGIAQRFGHVVDAAAGIALIGFGGWIAFSAWRDLHPTGGHRHRRDSIHERDHHQPHEHDPLFPHEHRLATAADRFYAPLRGDAALVTRHLHIHRHGGAVAHCHWHDHFPATAHPVLAGFATDPPRHNHRHKTTARAALLLILGSSPMVEGIPAFFAAVKYGVWLVSTMAAVFALSTIATYVTLCVCSTAGLQRLRLGGFERYGEVLSGAVIALIGLIFGLRPVL
jgi:nickel/cobalt transporter (NicO) family protein